MEYVDVNSKRWLCLYDLPNERWMDIEGYEGLYQISDYGRVKSLKRKIDKTHVYNEKILKQSYDKNGYLECSLSKNGISKQIRVHQYVGKYFVDNPNNKPIFDHLVEVEPNYCNNHYTNLKPSTYSENITRAYRTGRKIGKNNPKYGKDNGKAKEIIQYTIDMQFIREWDCISDVCKKYNYSHGNIVSCCRGRYKQAYGYIWRYKED